MPKSLEAMEAEVADYCRAKGWYDDEVSIPAALALLHEEVAEAGHAWREWGLEDATAGVTSDGPSRGYQAKPQGVGSELADVLIRLLDTSGRYGLGLPELYERRQGAYGVHTGFLDNINALHDLISRASMGWAAEPADKAELAHDLTGVMAFTAQLAHSCGINLQAEYERKMAYNHTREYRHGGRRA